MRHDCWSLWQDRGFLIHPDPIVELNTAIGSDFPIPAADIAELEAIAEDLPTLMETRRIRPTLDALPVLDMAGLNPLLDSIDFRIIERLNQIYAYFASAYVYAPGEETAKRIPRGVAVPLVQLAAMVERPPILSYAGYVLNNWRRSVHDAPLVVDRLTLNQPFLGNKDESWFILIHADIEARASGALNGVQAAAQAVGAADTAGVEAGLRATIDSLHQMMATFKRMPEGCDSDVYYFKVRPYIFGFNDVVYEGVFNDEPQTFRGQTGAQSSIIPALVAAFGLKHEKSSLTHHLEIMQDYMPRPHREFIARMKRAGIRSFVAEAGVPSLNEAYNEALRQLLAFRHQHYGYAARYIFDKVENPIGTGGTVFMEWLKVLITETEAQML
jgi:indoleamine 2,3-dioxygenase